MEMFLETFPEMQSGKDISKTRVLRLVAAAPS